MQSTNHLAQADLDAEELFRLGLKASTAEDPANALGYLKAAIEKNPDHPHAHWLLGAEYAQLGMMDRAQESMARALELAPDLAGARFQYGLLRLTSGDVAGATEVWSGLDAQPDDNPYKGFKQGLLLMVQDRLDEALDTIRRALALPQADAALKKDMEMIIGQIEQAKVTSATTSATASTDATAASAEPEDRLQFTAYRNSDRRH